MRVRHNYHLKQSENKCLWFILEDQPHAHKGIKDFKIAKVHVNKEQAEFDMEWKTEYGEWKFKTGR